MIPLVGPFSEIAKSRFDRNCERVASGTKSSTAVKLTVGVLVASVLIFIGLGAEVVRESAIGNAAEQKAQADGAACCQTFCPSRGSMSLRCRWKAQAFRCHRPALRYG